MNGPSPCRAQVSRHDRQYAVLMVALAVALSLILAGCSPAADVPGYSQTQQGIIDELGAPAAFQIAYLPSADLDDEGAGALRRTEVWYYPEHEQQISFIDGAALSVQGWEWQPEVPTEYPALSPADFHIGMTLDDVAAVLGVEPGDIEEIEVDPELSATDDVHVFATTEVVFTIERGALTYVQTLGTER